MTFRLIYEIEPPRVPDLRKIHSQIEIFGPLIDAVLVPDNHLGRPALSSVAIALELKRAGVDPIVALNARDRNHLRFASDLMTMKAYGLNEVVFLYGDPIDSGRTGLKVRQMLAHPEAQGIRRGVAANIGNKLGWRSEADFFMTQLAFGRGKPGYWREAHGFSQPLYCGVIALRDREIARKIVGNIPGLQTPPGYLESFDHDPDAGFKMALTELSELRDSGVDGAQLVVPTGRKRF
ncbi:MAG TPA: hypothetical protein VI541_03765, partial [Actinomycetota bacterium]|nr:hypothetical protein [Actinomycetota bacterium]